MIPELFKIGPFTVYSYGLMMGIAFIAGSYILTEEIKRKNLPSNIGTEVTLLAIIFGIIGGKLFHLLENWSSFLRDPIGMAFNPGGLTFYGGLILAIVAIWIYLRAKRIPFLYIADAASAPLALSYGIGRIGCHLAGDGDYGIPTDLPWGTNYENGTVPPSVMFRGSEIAKNYPGGVVPDNTPLHPTPIYEFLAMVVIFFILWKFRKKPWADGKLFMLYFILTGSSRLLVEFIRLNPRLLFGLSEAQLISIALIIIGIVGFIYFTRNKNLKKYVPPPQRADKKKSGKVKA
jgi:phosphatidylglycerol---prolipoprotein diacylglyceryl transferase